LLSSLLSLVSSQSNYICGVEGYPFYSDVPCNYYPVCANGGFKLNVGCQNDITCRLYSPNAVCIQQCCCSQPTIVGTTTLPNPIVRDSTPSISLFSSLLTVMVIVLLR
ncbi:hypothetical protein PENTCL1PPCAC_17389, partial [Pristionchus entomophagus]